MMTVKRTYTVPVLLIVLTLLAILMVLVYSKLLLTQQAQSIKEGKLLSEQYQDALIFADRLHEGAELLLQEHSTTVRAQAALLLGEAVGVKNDALSLLTEAADRSDSSSNAETAQQVEAAVAALFAESGIVIGGIAEQAGPITEDQTRLLQTVRDGAMAMDEALGRFRPPTVDSGYRSMAAGADWIDPALAAGQALIEMASKLD